MDTKPNPNIRGLSGDFLSNLQVGGEVSSYRRFNLASLQDKLDKREILPYTCIEGNRVYASYHSWHENICKSR